jgi:subtilisin family serine protease
VVVLVATLGPAAPARSVSGPRSTYIVELAVPPLAAHGGSIRAMGAGPAKRFHAQLDRSERQVLSAAQAGHAPVVHRYRTAFSGFAARLTAAEATGLAHTAGVVAVTPDTVSHPLADRQAAPPGDDALGQEPPGFLGLPGGIWARLGGHANAGEGVKIGVIDTGIYPEHPSFADKPLGSDGERYVGPAYDAPAGWKGICQTGANFPATACNNKLIGARYFVEGFGAENLKKGEFLSPRDANGHGSHVAATAAGNYGVRPRIAGHNLGIAAVSGIAPRARIAAYKVCWTGTAAGGDDVEGSCMGSDAVAAIDAAVADGVDVINYSVGSATSAVFGPVERAFLAAAAAGVFVANAAGNDGPTPGTIGSPTGAPWVTSVAATTLGRTFESTFMVTPGLRPGGTPAGAPEAVAGTGATLTGGLKDTALIDAATVAARGADAANAALCLPGALDRTKVAGKAVLCQRGENARVEKSKVVQEAGGVGLVLANTRPDEDVVADLHWIPAVHVSADDGAAIRALLADGGSAAVSIQGGRPVAGPADRIAPFSSRGPETDVPDIAKPDLGAPGVNILAADTPTPAGDGRPGETFQIVSGTSMASPEVAGAAALLAQLHPDWTPAAVKSALMTSAEARVTTEDGTRAAGPLDVGSGRIDPNRAATAGLVVDTPVTDYVRYLKAQVPEAVPDDTVSPLAAADLNLPSVAFSHFTGTGSAVRTFTSVDSRPQSWAVSVETPAGLLVSATPSTFHIDPGHLQPVTLTMRLAGAAPNAYTSGALLLTNMDDRRTVRLPVSVQPVKVDAAPRLDVAAAEAAGASLLQVRAGFNGTFSALGWGLVPGRVARGEQVATAPAGADQPWEASDGVRIYDVEVPAGTQLLAAEISNVDQNSSGSDLDLYLFRDRDGKGVDPSDVVARSAGPGAIESIALARPPAGSYRFAVVGFKTQTPSTFDFTTWFGADPTPDDPASPSTTPGFTVGGEPGAVTAGDAIDLALAWSRIETPGTYYGLVTYHDQNPADPQGPIAATLIRVTRGGR